MTFISNIQRQVEIDLKENRVSIDPKINEFARENAQKVIDTFQQELERLEHLAKYSLLCQNKTGMYERNEVSYHLKKLNLDNDNVDLDIYYEALYNQIKLWLPDWNVHRNNEYLSIDYDLSEPSDPENEQALFSKLPKYGIEQKIKKAQYKQRKKFYDSIEKQAVEIFEPFLESVKFIVDKQYRAYLLSDEADTETFRAIIPFEDFVNQISNQVNIRRSVFKQQVSCRAFIKYCKDEYGQTIHIRKPEDLSLSPKELNTYQSLVFLSESEQT